MTELKPCPFCGSEGESIVVDENEFNKDKREYRYRVVCTECMATVDTGCYQNKWVAIEAWNRRCSDDK